MIKNDLRGSGGGCFAPGTSILTPDGNINIEDISVGDIIISFNEIGKLVNGTVQEIHKHPSDKTILVEFWNGTLNITHNHWVLNQFNAFIEIGNLGKDDALIDVNDHLRPIINISEGIEGEVYNLTVDNHTFIADCIRVHNGGNNAEKYRDIKGSGGPGGSKSSGGQSTPAIEAPDSLRSQQNVRVLDLLCEGEIEGLVDGLKSIFIDGVPIQNRNGTGNFSGVYVETRNGTQLQSYMEGFPASEKEIVVGTRVKQSQANGITRQISNANVNQIRVTISVPSLFKTNTKTGDVNGTSVRINIQVQTDGGGYVTKVDNTIKGKTTTLYQRTYLITLPPAITAWDIRVKRITKDSTSAALQNRTFWDSYTEIINEKFSYPNSALIGMSVNSEQFSRIPSRGYEIRGLKINIPSNYNPITGIYTGQWDGTFKVAWSDNPAWVYYDMIINDRYGLGKFIAVDQIDKWALFTIGQYCDVLVKDGFGGAEPRFVANVYIQTRSEAFSVINTLASIFRGSAYWGAGLITAVQDAPADSQMLFTNANVVDGTFNYSGSALRTRHTVALVTWNDPDNSYRQQVEYVPDDLGISLYGVRETEVLGVGVTSRGQAARVGKAILLSERLETDTVIFRAGIDGTSVTPGMIFETSDQDKIGLRFGGRIVSATLNSVTLDGSVTLSVNETYQINLTSPDGTIEIRTVTNAPGVITVLNTSIGIQIPQPNAVWVISASNVAPEKWRCIGVAEGENLTVEIVGLNHVPEKYELIEDGVLLNDPVKFFRNPPGTPGTPGLPSAPKNLIVSEELYQSSPGRISNRAILEWDRVKDAVKYRVVYVKGDNNPTTRNNITVNYYQIDNANAGRWTFHVTAFDSNDTASPTSTLVVRLKAATKAPITPKNFTVQLSGGLSVLRWTRATELDVIVGGGYNVRFSSLVTANPSWSRSVSMGGRISGASSGISVPLSIGTYFIKSVDAGGRYSPSAARALMIPTRTLATSNITTINEDPDFNGTNNDTRVGDEFLTIESGDLVDDWGLADNIVEWDSGQFISSEGIYDFSSPLDLGTVKKVKLEKFIESLTTNKHDIMDSRLELIDDWLDFDATAGNESDATVWVRETDDDPNKNPTWGDYNLLDESDYQARGFDFQARLITFDQNHNIEITSLGVVVDEIDILEDFVVANDLSLVFDNDLNITLHNVF